MTTNTSASSIIHSDVISRLIKWHKRIIKHGVIIFSIITLISIAITSVCFVFVKINASKSNNIAIPLVFGIIGTLAMISFLIILCLVCRSWHDGLNWMYNVQHMIQLDGELWHKQIYSLQNTIPPKEVRVLCRDLNYDYFKRNPSGHIVFAVEGIIIDAIFVIRYDLYVVHQVHLIHNTENTGYILRLVLVTRINSLNNDIDKGLQIAFEIYLFMASHIQLQQITNIRESILSNSHKHLAATGYYKKVRNDLQLNTINR